MLKNAVCPVCLQYAHPLFPVLYGKTPMVAGIPCTVKIVPWINECSACNIRFAHPSVPKETLDACYEKAGNEVWRDDPHNAQRRGFPEIVRFMESVVPDRSILDIGCYTGAFLDTFSDSWQKFGVEPSTVAADQARTLGIDIIGSDIDDVELPLSRYGCISSMSVLEHVADPRRFLEKIVSSLGPGGILLLQTGDFNSYFARLMSKSWSYYHIPEHISFFSDKSLPDLLTSLGLEIVKVSRNVYHKKPRGLLPWLIHGLKVFHALTKRITSKFISDENNSDQVPWVTCCDHMVVFARKK